MKEESIYHEYPSTLENEAEYFLLLNQLDDLKQEKKLAEQQNRGQYEQDKLFKAIEKLENKIKRNGEALDGIKATRNRSKAPATLMVEDYLAEHPEGSVLTKRQDKHDKDIPNIYEWATELIDVDLPINKYEIIGVKWGKYITLSYNKRDDIQCSNKTLENKISSIRTSNKNKLTTSS